MRLLFVSNLYPPYHIGGYEQVCQRTAEALRSRGHQVHVLTSCFGSGPAETGTVHRALTCAYQPPSWFPDAGPEEARRNSRILALEIAARQPDVVVLWNLHGLGLYTLYATALERARQVATRLGDYQFWPNWDPARSIPSEGLSVLRDRRLRCAVNCRTLGADLVRAGMRPADIAVLRAFVELEPAMPQGVADAPPPARLLWAGRIAEQKGLRVATIAASILARDYRIPTRLDIVGSGDESLLASCLSEAGEVAGAGIDLQVRYLGPASRAQLARLFPRYHVYVASSIGHEVFPMTCVEAMAAGTPLVASRLGGLVEVTQGGRLGLLARPGDPADLAGQLARLVTDRRLWHRLRADARSYVEREFGEKVSVDRFESFLAACANGIPVASMPSSVPKMSDPQSRLRRVLQKLV